MRKKVDDEFKYIKDIYILQFFCTELKDELIELKDELTKIKTENEILHRFISHFVRKGLFDNEKS